jgi:hypothetical protein
LNAIIPPRRVSGPMAEPFDPYRKWLGIPPKEQPPHHYRLLGIATFEDDPDVIENAAARQMSHVRTFQTSKQHGPISQRILTELSAAKLCLLSPASKADYDAQLRSRLAAAGELSSADLTGAIAAEAEAVEAVAEPDLPPLRTGGDFRWRTGAATEAISEPPPVPIPMPPVVSSSPASAPAFPAFRPAATKPSAARAYRKSSPLPVLLIVGSLIGLVVLGGVAIVFANLGTDVPPAKPAAASAPRPETKPGGTDNKTAQKPANEGTAFPVGSAVSSSGSGTPPTPFPVPAAIPTPSPSPPPTTSPANSGDLAEQMRQALFLSETALKQRHDRDFREHFAVAEQLAGNKDLPEQAKFQEQVDDLRVLKQLNDEFWATIRDNLQSKVQVGERIEFHQHKFELLARDGETIEYSINGEMHAGKVMELQPKAAILIASKSVKWDDPVTFLPIAAFLSVDGKITDDNERKFGKQLFAIGRLIGKANPALGRKFGLKDLNEEIKLDEDLANKVPLPPGPEKKPE